MFIDCFNCMWKFVLWKVVRPRFDIPNRLLQQCTIYVVELQQNPKSILPDHEVISNHWTGLLDWTDGLMDLITRVNLFISHDFKCCNFSYSNCIGICCTSSSRCMLVNVYKCTSYMDGCVPWVCSVHAVIKLKAPSDYSKYAKSIKSTLH